MCLLWRKIFESSEKKKGEKISKKSTENTKNKKEE